MLENLTDRFNKAFRGLSGRGRISESNIRDAMRDVRTALLEADVHLDVAKEALRDGDEGLLRPVEEPVDGCARRDGREFAAAVAHG